MLNAEGQIRGSFQRCRLARERQAEAEAKATHMVSKAILIFAVIYKPLIIVVATKYLECIW